MPIVLDDLMNTAFAPTPRNLTPKFFDKDILTGNGKSSGLINQNLRPGRYQSGEGPHSMQTGVLGTKAKTTGSGITTHAIPTGVLTQYSIESNIDRGLHFPMPALDELFHITSHATSLSYDAWLGLTPQGLIVTKDGSGDAMITESRVCYRMEVYLAPVGQNPDKVLLTDRTPTSVDRGLVLMGWSFAPLDDVEDLIRKATLHVSPQGQGTFVNVDDLAEWMDDYDLYDRLCSLANVWSSLEIADQIGDHITDLFATGTPSDAALNRLISQLRYLETYPVALEAYRQIHATLIATCPPDVARVLVKQNVNLLINHELQALDDLKPQLTSLPPAPNGAASINPMFSSQQLGAITSEDPLVLLQSGAGTGKSSTILARIAHLTQDRGVDPNDIMVISFTNAAADNIREKNPHVGSSTIARMIHEIYSLNHPTHELSSVETIVNSLSIYFPTNPLASSFQQRLIATDIRRSVPGATTALNGFVEHYRNEVLEMLDTIGQTCLELEIILAYQLIDTMVEPAHISSRYLIVDEVQDNSIFEFIYILRYVAKHMENLFIVGDASQTLYEFRASNPKALNALEASGIFQCYQLTTNYRSNQSILDFANLHLRGIEANQIAQIQLRANSLVVPTAKEFTDRVTLDYRWGRTKSEFRDHLPAYVQNVLRPWIDSKLALDEQVAVLAPTRAEVAIVEEGLKKIYPNQEVVNLVSERMYSTTVFSEFIKQHWDEILQLPNLAQAAYAVTTGISNHLPSLVRGDVTKQAPAVKRMTVQWWQENAVTVNTWVQLTQQTNASTGAPLMSSDEFFSNLKDNLLKFEISRNAARQSVINQRNKERKEAKLRANAKLIVSTIHGAKGLEFDNVIGLYKYDSQLDEPTKRAYYVMLTRAINAEFVLAHGTIKKPKIEADYQIIVNDLLRKQQIAALRAQGYDPDMLDEDETAAALAHMKKLAEDAIAAGDFDKAAQYVPEDVEVVTRGPALPSDDEDEEQDGDSEDDSAFTKATN